MNKSETLAACGFPDLPFTFHDEPGEHDPCYVVMPGGCTLALNHCAPGMMDINRAMFIIAACNAALERLTATELLESERDYGAGDCVPSN